MAQPLAASNSAAERELLRAVIKRNESARQITVLYDLSVEIERNEKSIPLFCARRREIDDVMASFRLWQSVILDQLVILDRHTEYTHTGRHSQIFSEITHKYYCIKSVKNDFYGSVAGLSQF